ncbi:hypothetical protein ACQP25_44310 (plasmid) [Microtetraspora malaysiensis]|uniref:hypothetical protein n=1 Tax=Microtetraspora malaysiensis TaxID=161358 RepID=UPI003D942B46
MLRIRRHITAQAMPVPARWEIRRDALRLTRDNAVKRDIRLFYASEYIKQASIIATWLEQATDLTDYQARIAAIEQIVTNGGRSGIKYGEFGKELVHDATDFYKFFTEEPKPATV